MKEKLLIRISAIFVLIHFLGHFFGHLNWDNENSPLYAVVKEMKSHSAEFMGVTKTMADYYNGYSLIILLLFGMSIAVLWILSNHTSNCTKLVKQILFVFGLFYLIFGLIEFFYFFPFAAIISILAGIFSLLATFKFNKK